MSVSAWMTTAYLSLTSGAKLWILLKMCIISTACQFTFFKPDENNFIFSIPPTPIRERDDSMSGMQWIQVELWPAHQSWSTTVVYISSVFELIPNFLYYTSLLINFLYFLLLFFCIDFYLCSYESRRPDENRLNLPLTTYHPSCPTTNWFLSLYVICIHIHSSCPPLVSCRLSCYVWISLGTRAG